MKLLVVIVNFRTAALTLEALEHLLPDMEGLDAAVTVVDNDSGDGSLKTLDEQVTARGWGDRVSVVDSGKNGGFGFGNNVAIRRALAQPSPPEYVYLHNPDAAPHRLITTREPPTLSARLPCEGAGCN